MYYLWIFLDIVLKVEEVFCDSNYVKYNVSIYVKE